MKDRAEGILKRFKVAQSLCALSPHKQGGRLARCRANKVFLMALKCIIYLKKLGFVLCSEKQFAKRCSTLFSADMVCATKQHY